MIRLMQAIRNTLRNSTSWIKSAALSAMCEMEDCKTKTTVDIVHIAHVVGKAPSVTLGLKDAGDQSYSSKRDYSGR